MCRTRRPSPRRDNIGIRTARRSSDRIVLTLDLSRRMPLRSTALTKEATDLIPPLTAQATRSEVIWVSLVTWEGPIGRTWRKSAPRDAFPKRRCLALGKTMAGNALLSAFPQRRCPGRMRFPPPTEQWMGIDLFRPMRCLAEEGPFKMVKAGSRQGIHFGRSRCSAGCRIAAPPAGRRSPFLRAC